MARWIPTKNDQEEIHFVEEYSEDKATTSKPSDCRISRPETPKPCVERLLQLPGALTKCRRQASLTDKQEGNDSSRRYTLDSEDAQKWGDK